MCINERRNVLLTIVVVIITRMKNTNEANVTILIVRSNSVILNTVATLFLMRQVPVTKSGQLLVSTPLMLVTESPKSHN